ncbi:hypothetical protein [Marinobacter caseinilyticus]|uniref:hypothetical protein n=1 Tax=Marinobacter caseinilyticus TaxID=2692195 RepID=UPI0014078492|nr:hypothetical protein [Marinobacter caseinilyticus]
MEAVYLIPLPVNQVSVPVAEVPAMVAKAMHPKNWDLWEGRDALFYQLAARIWHRMSWDFQSEVDAARGVRSILESQGEPSVLAVLPKLSGNNFYQLYLAGMHIRLLSKAVGDGEITLIDRTPYGAKPITPDDGRVEFRGTDRLKVRDLARYLRPYGVVVDESVSVAAGGEVGSDKAPRVLVNEKRGKIILRVLQKMNFDPENLPPYRRGTESEVKVKTRKEVRREALKDFAPSGDEKKFNKAFDRAWGWLSKSRRINHPCVDS